jgi:hypothetical protein
MKIMILLSGLLFSSMVYSQKKTIDIPGSNQTGAKPQINTNVLEGRPVMFSAGNAVVFGSSGDMKFNQRYNTNPMAVAVGGSSVTIKKAGLYHFEGMYSVGVYGAGASSLPEINFSLAAGADQYALAKKKIIPQKDLDKSNSYQCSELYSIDLYIPAGTVITLKRSIGSAEFASPSNIMTEGWFTGYLVTQ